MPKLVVAKPEEKKETPVILHLEEHPNGDVSLVATRGSVRSELLYLNSEGIVNLYYGVEPDLEFQVDDDGRLKIAEA